MSWEPPWWRSRPFRPGCTGTRNEAAAEIAVETLVSTPSRVEVATLVVFNRETELLYEELLG